MPRHLPARTLVAMFVCVVSVEADEDPPWKRHTIDRSSRGADGTRLADQNGDGRLDIATGWEEGGVVKLAFHPGREKVREPWPTVTVGRVASPEDAVLVDLDRDGAPDVVSSSEGGFQRVHVHWAPKDRERSLDAGAWSTVDFPALRGRAQWMFARPIQIDGQNGPDLVLGSKGTGAELGWLEAPAEARDAAAWRWHALRQVGWIMSIEALDLDGDQDLDLLVSDRRGAGRGLFWLECPGGARVTGPWVERSIGPLGQHEVMFLDARLDAAGVPDIVVATKGKGILRYRRQSAAKSEPEIWRESAIAWPERAGSPKAVAWGDLDLDRDQDLVYSCEHARGREGIGWLEAIDADSVRFREHPLSGPEGTKFDLLELSDLDGDGDLDVISCEEREGLGVFWYENPRKPSEKRSADRRG